jgi:hypothetical protein
VRQKPKSPRVVSSHAAKPTATEPLALSIHPKLGVEGMPLQTLQRLCCCTAFKIRICWASEFGVSPTGFVWSRPLIEGGGGERKRVRGEGHGASGF